jgi:hypothetical protein
MKRHEYIKNVNGKPVHCVGMYEENWGAISEVLGLPRTRSPEIVEAVRKLHKEIDDPVMREIYHDMLLHLEGGKYEKV